MLKDDVDPLHLLTIPVLVLWVVFAPMINAVR